MHVKFVAGLGVAFALAPVIASAHPVDITFPVGTTIYYDQYLYYHCDRPPLHFRRFGGLFINNFSDSYLHKGGLSVPRLNSDFRTLTFWNTTGAPFAVTELVAVEAPFEGSVPTGTFLNIRAKVHGTNTILDEDFSFDLNNKTYDTFRLAQRDIRFLAVDWVSIDIDSTIGIDNIAYFIDRIKTWSVGSTVGSKR